MPLACCFPPPHPPLPFHSETPPSVPSTPAAASVSSLRAGRPTTISPTPPHPLLLLLHRRILDCDEAYNWCLFYYSGAASAAGLSYSGAVLGSRSGAMPTAGLERIEAALDAAGIKMWELSYVDNSDPSGVDLSYKGA